MQMVSPVHSKRLLRVCVKMITWSTSIENGQCCFCKVQNFLMWEQATTSGRHFEKLISKHRCMLAIDLNSGEWQVHWLQYATVYGNSFPVVYYKYWTDHKARRLVFQCQIYSLSLCSSLYFWIHTYYLLSVFYNFSVRFKEHYMRRQYAFKLNLKNSHQIFEILILSLQ